ncbi:MAG: hypothetical protein KIG88_01090 [Weeksellaceae bacterium]|nr:hypothetical protein [Weeksellaceae bacterium]
MKIFKFFIVISFMFTIMGCTSDDDNYTNKSHFNPPNWIHGKWSTSLQNDTLELKFDYHNVYITSTEETNYNDIINTSISSGQIQMRVEEEVSDNSYYFTISSSTTREQFIFKRVSDAKLIYLHRNNEIELYRKSF